MQSLSEVILLFFFHVRLQPAVAYDEIESTHLNLEVLATVVFISETQASILAEFVNMYS